MFTSLARKLAASLALTAVTAVAAQAQTGVEYQTLYSFTNGGFAPVATQMLRSGTSMATLTFVGQGPTYVTAPSFIDYGTVTATGLGGSAMFDALPIYLEIVQLLPSVGTAKVVGSVSGAVSFTSSGAVINWNEPSRFATIGTATYELEKLSQGYTSINAPTSGPQTIRGYVTAASTVPEPSTWALMGTGLVSLGGVAVRRRRAATA